MFLREKTEKARMRDCSGFLQIKSHIIACGVDKINLKWWEIQLAVHHGVGCLVAIK